MKTLFAIPSFLECQALFPLAVTQVGKLFKIPKQEIYVSVLGVGLVEFSKNLTTLLLQETFDQIVLLGIAGAYKNSGLSLGEVVFVTSECVGDLGIENPDFSFTPWHAVAHENLKTYQADLKKIPDYIKPLKQVFGVSLNCTTGSEKVAKSRESLFQASVESMEGAAFYSIGNAFQIPCFEIRAISNFVTHRDKSSWKIKEALQALKQTINPLLL